MPSRISPTHAQDTKILFDAVMKSASDVETDEGDPLTSTEASSSAGEKPGFRRCRSVCRKLLAIAEFHAKEARCKKCRARETAALRRFPQLAETRRTDPKVYIKFVKAFDRMSPPDSTNCNRRSLDHLVNLSLSTTASASTGQRYMGKTKMMWEREFYEEAAKTAMGNMTQEEAARQWAEWLGNPEWPRDNEGPRGFLRLEVPIGDYGARYTEFASGRVVSIQDKQKKRGNQGDLDGMLNQLTAGHDSMGGGATERLADISKKVSGAVAEARSGQRALVHEGNSAAMLTNPVFHSEGMLMPDFDTILDSITPKKPSAKIAERIAESDGSGEEGPGQDKLEEGRGKKDDWLDDSLVAKSVRALRADVRLSLGVAWLCHGEMALWRATHVVL